MVEFTEKGYLHLTAEEAARFPTHTVIALLRDDELWLMPVRRAASGGLLLKQINRRGDRSLFVEELFRDRPGGYPVGKRSGRWDEERGAFIIPLEPAQTLRGTSGTRKP
ncbi:hydrogenase maturation protease [Hydrogenibacillus sp. N12]|uniref:hydrogenase maturation protease n=1 Tax=Hydrogenibacillus sp. N12 TaxID=2866627 RepID=UPI001C7D5725|nr:hydrogenase maturation protease [Hydrogenibacillus sp. N12]QZA32622.1 hydrogenase maturation protease [Hydrogenibacillus sp. N12]